MHKIGIDAQNVMNQNIVFANDRNESLNLKMKTKITLFIESCLLFDK